MSGSSFMSLPKPWNIGTKADNLSWDMLYIYIYLLYIYLYI